MPSPHQALSGNVSLTATSSELYYVQPSVFSPFL